MVEVVEYGISCGGGSDDSGRGHRGLQLQALLARDACDGAKYLILAVMVVVNVLTTVTAGKMNSN